MTDIRLGQMAVPVLRSGFRWLLPDGAECRPRQPFAYCTLGVEGLADQDVQVLLSSPVGGRLRHMQSLSEGGYLDRLPAFHWHPEHIVAQVEGGQRPNVDAELLFVAGRRFADGIENRVGPLGGWHARRRGWWGGAGGTSLIGLGPCEQDAILRGDDGCFGDWHAATRGPAQIILAQAEPQVPCASVLVEQLARTEADLAAIRADVAASFPPAGHVPDAADWLFIGAVLRALEDAPLAEQTVLLGREGLSTSAPPAAISLSLGGELPVAARHRRLGWTLNVHHYRIAALGPAVRAWLRANFEPVMRSVEHVRADYGRLIAALPGRQLFVINAPSAPAHEQVTNYRLLDEQSFASLGGVRAKELNLMLHDLERSHGIAIIDADAIAADMGTGRHLRDGTHASGALNREIAAELRRQLNAWGFPGFA